MLDRDLIDEIRTANDIASVVSGYVRLKRSGSSLSGLCPFHKEKTPSFHVSEERQSFHCFGCGVGGNVITFVMMIENFDFLDAVKFLAERANIEIEHSGSAERAEALQNKKKTLYEIHKKAARFYYDSLNGPYGKPAEDYINSRSLTGKIRIKCGLGYSPNNGPSLYSRLKNDGYADDILLESGLIVRAKSGGGYYDRFFDRLMFPILDVSGRVVGFGGRTLSDGIPKYLNSPETPIFEKGRLLYGLNFARKEKKREIIVVEGYMDAIALYQAGFMNAVASLGTAFTIYHARLLKSYSDSVILLFDSDDAGAAAVYRALPHLVQIGLNVKVARLSGAKDPDDYIKRFGSESLAKALAEAKGHIAFRISEEMKKHDLEGGVEQRVAFTKEAAKILKAVTSEIERDAYIKETAKLTGISERAIRAETEGEAEEHIQRRPVRFARRDADGAPKNVAEAQKRLLGLIAANRAAFEKSRGHINETDFTNQAYKELYGLIVDFHKKGREIRAVEIISYLDTADKQREAYDALSAAPPPGDPRELERDFNDQIRAIKLYNIGREIEEIMTNNDGEGLKTAHNQQKALSNLYISLTDG